MRNSRDFAKYKLALKGERGMRRKELEDNKNIVGEEDYTELMTV
jgi:hypothetical protein